MLQNEDIIYICEGEWSFKRGGHMSSFFPRLLKANRMLYIDLPTSSQVYYKYPKMGLKRLKSVVKGNERTKDEFLHIFTFSAISFSRSLFFIE